MTILAETTIRGWKIEAEDMRPDYEGPVMSVTSPCGKYFGSGLTGSVADLHGREKVIPMTIVTAIEDLDDEAFAIMEGENA